MDESIFSLLKPDKPLAPIPTGLNSRGKSLKNIRAVIFDIYGTLLISGSGDVGTAMESGSAEAFKSAFARVFGTAPDDSSAAIIRDLFFSSISETHSRMKSEGYPYPEVDIIEVWKGILSDRQLNHLQIPADDITASLMAAAYESTVNPVWPMPGAGELIRKLHASGVYLGIISNAQFYTPVIFEYLFNSDLGSLGFSPELCLFSYIEKRSKPDTSLFDKLTIKIAECGIKPAESVFIGNDMLKDIMPAAVSGYRTILFAGDKRSLRMRSDHDACSNIEPDVIVSNLLDITDYIQEGHNEKTFPGRKKI